MKVGETADAQVSMFALTLAQSDACGERVVSVRWITVVPGVVAFGPGTSIRRAVVTAQMLGDTEVRAEITLRGGAIRRTSLNPTVHVVTD
jgi:hypothetical protein